uniref:Beta-lactamase domain-containing protein n=1 Tax=Globodera pallida TaxID=36090 RepID=A0A183BRZ5_GLOPA
MRPEKTVFGKCSPKFANVEKAFRRNFADGWERDGASLAVYWKGQLVVDLCGGYADKASLRRWDEGTRTILFSVTKAVAALAVHILVDRGCIAYSDTICTHWPEFARNGKERITLQDVLLHRAGLAVFDETVTLEAARDPIRIGQIIEAQKPNWALGSRSGYHAVTFGWLLDQIVRRVDPKKRGIAQFIREEITDKHGIDFHLGLPMPLAHTVSRLAYPPLCYQLRELVRDPRVLVVQGVLHLRTRHSLRSRVVKNTPWVRVDGKVNTFNNPKIFCGLEQAAALGISRAKDVGKIFALMLSGQLISQELLNQLSKPQIINQTDYVMKIPVSKGYGFMFEKHPRKPGKWLYGHPGFGGSTVMVDPEEELVIAYVSNGMKTAMGELTGTYRRLRKAAINAVMAISDGRCRK